MDTQMNTTHYFSYDEEGYIFYLNADDLIKNTPRIEDCYVYRGNVSEQDIEGNEDDYRECNVIDYLKDPKNAEYNMSDNQDDIERLKQTINEQQKEIDIILKERRVGDHDYECLKQAFKDLMLKYIKVSMSSDNPIYDDPLTLDNTNEDTCYKLRVSEILDEMNKDDWNEDYRTCRLVMEPTWAPRGVCITTECVSDNEDDSDDEQYQQLCNDCNTKLCKNTHIYCLEHKNTGEELTICSSCFDERVSTIEDFDKYWYHE